jgi:hypothetical protein
VSAGAELPSLESSAPEATKGQLSVARVLDGWYVARRMLKQAERGLAVDEAAPERRVKSLA